jgi:hypothetical protein
MSGSEANETPKRGGYADRLFRNAPTHIGFGAACIGVGILVYAVGGGSAAWRYYFPLAFGIVEFLLGVLSLIIGWGFKPEDDA